MQNRPDRVTQRNRDTLLQLLETLPDALFVIDDDATIVYANASAQAITGTIPAEIVSGTSLWRAAPQMVSTALYQAVRKTKQTRALTEVEYRSPVTQICCMCNSLRPLEGSSCSFSREEH